MRVLTIVAVASGVTMLAWAVLSPLLGRREANRLYEEARQTLSPPIKGLTDLDEVECDRAALLLKKALDHAPSNGRARREYQLAQGCSALRRGDLVLAESSLRAASRQLPGDARPRRWLGSLAMAQGRPDNALRHYRQALLLDESDLASQVGLSDALAELGQPEEALSAIEVIDRTPSLGLIETRRGMVLEALDRFEEARAAYLAAIELAPESAEPRNNLAALERDEGRLDEAWRLQQEAIELSPDDPVMLLNGGLLAIARGHDEQALELLRRAAGLDHDSADPSRALADHLLVMGQAETALEALDPAIDRFPRDAALRNTLGNALSAAGRLDEARAAYRTSSEIDPTLAEPHNGLAALMLSADDLSGAEAELEIALRLAPDHTQARRNQAELFRRRGELELADREGRLAQALGSGPRP